jgi:hypothetical protein
MPEQENNAGRMDLGIADGLTIHGRVQRRGIQIFKCYTSLLQIS